MAKKGSDVFSEISNKVLQAVNGEEPEPVFAQNAERCTERLELGHVVHKYGVEGCLAKKTINS